MSDTQLSGIFADGRALWVGTRAGLALVAGIVLVVRVRRGPRGRRA